MPSDLWAKLIGVWDMIVKLVRDVNVIFESAQVLYHEVSGNSCRFLRDAMLKKSNVEPQVIESCFNPIMDLSEDIFRHIPADRSVTEYLFGGHSELDRCFAFYILHDIFRTPSPDFETDIERIRSISRAEFFVNLYSLLSDEFPDTEYKGEVRNYGELINFIGALPLSSELKWQLCSFYNNFDAMRSALAAILYEAGKLYIERFDKVKHYVGWFVSNYEQSVGSDAVAYITENYGLNLKSSPDILYIVPSIAMCSDSLYLMNYTSDKESDFYCIGVLNDPLRGFGDPKANDELLCRALKVMGDPRKFETLKLLAQKPRYGRQLAHELQISTATVSHHMAQLLELDLVKIDRDANRVYYTLNREKLKTLFSDFSKLFLTE
jgi:DNA-binding transcriptional ArsR family regulator